MIFFDVTWEVMNYTIGIDVGALYYTEEEELVRLYYVQNNNVVLQYSYVKKGSEEDLIWKDTYLKRGIRVLRLNKNKVNLVLRQDGDS